jgi:hypothetical protein
MTAVKAKLTRLSWLVSVRNGQIKIADATRARMLREVERLEDWDNCKLTLTREARPKTHKQLGLWHVALIPQIQDFFMSTEGVFKSVDRVKQEMCTQFLKPRPQYYTDGSPVMVNLPHPERKGVFYQWHFEKQPSLEDLDVDEMRSLIDAVLNYFHHDRGYPLRVGK